MADLITTERSNIIAIADAVRNRIGENGDLTIREIISGINGIESGEKTPFVEELNVTQNGIYTVPEGVDGYSPVTVSVLPKLEYGKYVIPDTTPKFVSPSVGYDGLGEVEIAGDTNLVSDNIKSGVSIFGVEGSFEENINKTIVTVTASWYPCNLCTPDGDYIINENWSQETKDIVVNVGSICILYGGGSSYGQNVEGAEKIYFDQVPYTLGQENIIISIFKVGNTPCQCYASQ